MLPKCVIISSENYFGWLRTASICWR